MDRRIECTELQMYILSRNILLCYVHMRESSDRNTKTVSTLKKYIYSQPPAVIMTPSMLPAPNDAF